MEKYGIRKEGAGVAEEVEVPPDEDEEDVRP
jgi:hypothetical protein